MQRHNSYPYAFGVAAPTRYASHGTSSAQSPSANPDEDWTKISDLAERRRIQNRIAQRNYRKKLKRRLEDLERRAGSSSASPEQKPAELAGNVNGIRKEDAKKRRSLSKPSLTPTKPAGRSPVPPPAASFPTRNDDGGMFAKQYHRQLSASPPPSLTYSSYGPADGLPAPVYPSHGGQYNNTLPAPYAEYQASPSVYLPPPPMSRATYGSYDAMAPGKPEAHYADDDLINNFSFSYASMHAIDAPASSAPSFDNAYAPSVSDSFAPFGHSRTASPANQSLGSFAPPQANLNQHPVLGF